MNILLCQDSLKKAEQDDIDLYLYPSLYLYLHLYYLYLYLMKEFILRNWLMLMEAKSQVCRLGWQAGDPGKSWNSNSRPRVIPYRIPFCSGEPFKWLDEVHSNHGGNLFYTKSTISSVNLIQQHPWSWHKTNDPPFKLSAYHRFQWLIFTWKTWGDCEFYCHNPAVHNFAFDFWQHKPCGYKN